MVQEAQREKTTQHSHQKEHAYCPPADPVSGSKKIMLEWITEDSDYSKPYTFFVWPVGWAKETQEIPPSMVNSANY